MISSFCSEYPIKRTPSLSTTARKGSLLAALPDSDTSNLQVLGKSLNRMSLENKCAWFKLHLHLKYLQTVHMQILTPVHQEVKDVWRHLSAIWLHKCRNPQLQTSCCGCFCLTFPPRSGGANTVPFILLLAVDVSKDLQWSLGCSQGNP